MDTDAPRRGAPGRRPTVAVFYLARGQGERHLDDFATFIASYRMYPAGYEHRLYIVFKGFADDAARKRGEEVFAGVEFDAIETDDSRFDLGAYADATDRVEEDVVCFFNTFSEILSPFWLAKLMRNLDSPGVGMVSATGSCESLAYINRLFPPFPNPHLRSNAFAMRRRDALSSFSQFQIADKLDCFFIESGPDSLTRQMFGRGLTCLIVGADGRGFDPGRWPMSGTSRQGTQHNLLVADNFTRQFDAAAASFRRECEARSWGRSTPPEIVDAC